MLSHFGCCRSKSTGVRQLKISDHFRVELVETATVGSNKTVRSAVLVGSTQQLLSRWIRIPGNVDDRVMGVILGRDSR